MRVWAEMIGMGDRGSGVDAGRLAGDMAVVAMGVVGALCLADLSFAVVLVVLAFSAGWRGVPGRRVAAVLGSLVAFAALRLLLSGNGLGWFLVTTVLLFGGALPWLTGRHLRLRRHLADAGWRLAERLDSERELLVEQARLRERAQIARDMHDVLGHELSLLALRASGLVVDPRADSRVREEAGQLRAGAAAAVEQLRRIVTVLRVDAPAQHVAAGVSVPALVERARSAGLAVHLRWECVEQTLAEPSARVDGTVLRVVQECLTNAARHAHGSPVQVSVCHRPPRVLVRVVNDLVQAATGVPEPAHRHGLTGLAERVAQAGGHLQAAIRGGRFEVTADLPLDEPQALRAKPGGRGMPARMARTRQRVRRDLLVALGVPVAVVSAVSLGYYGVVTHRSVLEPAQFAQLQAGQSVEVAQARLPARQVPSFGRVAVEPPSPFGATCEYYSDGNFPAVLATYRVCFSGGAVVSKDLLQAWR